MPVPFRTRPPNLPAAQTGADSAQPMSTMATTATTGTTWGSTAQTTAATTSRAAAGTTAAQPQADAADTAAAPARTGPKRVGAPGPRRLRSAGPVDPPPAGLPTPRAALASVDPVLTRARLRTLRQRFLEDLRRTGVGLALLENEGLRNTALRPATSDLLLYAACREGAVEGCIEIPLSGTPANRQESIAAITHEALHRFHHLRDPEGYRHRLASRGTHPGWDNAEEQYTITGHDPTGQALDTDLHENAARRELGLPVRHSHAPPGSDLPRPMDAQEYRAYRDAQARQEGLRTGSTTAKRPRPARLSGHRPARK